MIALLLKKELYNWYLFHLGIVNYTFYLSKGKIPYRYDHLFAYRTSLHDHTLIHCRFNTNRKPNRSPGKFGGIFWLHYLVVARNTTLEEVSCKVNSVSENTLYRYVDGFNLNRISIFHNKHFGIPFSAVIKWSIF